MAFNKSILLAILLPFAFAKPLPTATSVVIESATTATATTSTSTPAPQQTHLIHPNGNNTLCLAVVNPADDVPTQILPCDAAAQSGDKTGKFVHWVFVPGDNMSLRLEGWELCLDAGSSPINNGPAKVYTCYPGLAQQHWYYTPDEHIALTGGNQCLDQTNGSGAPQTYQCASNTNQVWSTTVPGQCVETNCGLPDTSMSSTATAFSSGGVAPSGPVFSYYTSRPSGTALSSGSAVTPSGPASSYHTARPSGTIFSSGGVASSGPVSSYYTAGPSVSIFSSGGVAPSEPISSYHTARSSGTAISSGAVASSGPVSSFGTVAPSATAVSSVIVVPSGPVPSFSTTTAIGTVLSSGTVVPSGPVPSFGTTTAIGTAISSGTVASSGPVPSFGTVTSSASATTVHASTVYASSATSSMVPAPQQTHQIHPREDTSLCLAVVNPANDVSTQLLPCAGSATSGDKTGKFSRWVFIPGDNLSVRLEGWELCLDAGSNPANNGPAKVYTCYPGLAQQHWYYTPDNRLALTGGNQCLDRTNGNAAPQTYQCTTGNLNQVFTTTEPN